MIHVKFEWEGEEFGATFENETQAQKAFNWLANKYPKSKILEVRSFDNAPTIRKLYEEREERG